jgi:MFS family permease
MNAAARRVQQTYLTLLLLHTLAASFIWGINTLFLLDAGLTNTQAFAANAFFTAGMVLFEVPTGVVADTRGRRTSYLIGTITLAISTVLYVLMWRVKAPFAAWAVVSAVLGLGFTFFSGAVEAWLVDALTFTGYMDEGGTLESVFARGQIVQGIAMLGGSVAGGVIAQATNLGVPYIVRAVVLLVLFIVAFTQMHDIGFTPARGKSAMDEVKDVLQRSIKHGLGSPPVRWVMLTAPFTMGVSFYVFYAAQPYLLQLYGNTTAYSVAGLAAAILASAQVAGGFLVPYVGRLFRRRTSLLLAGTAVSTIILSMIGLFPNFWMAISLLVLWGLMFAAMTPVRQTYLNGLIDSKQRATVLSFDSMMGSTGGVAIQPVLGRVADVWSYPTSYVASGALQALAIPFLFLARRERASSDAIGTKVVEAQQA